MQLKEYSTRIQVNKKFLFRELPLAIK